jgi:MbtH protein
MVNPFDDEAGTYVVLRNAENQHSLWPQSVSVPAGWEVVFGPRDSRQRCIEFIEENWTDMRPSSLIAAVEGR